MANFTRNAWVTGETITADNLNGGKGIPLIQGSSLEISQWSFDVVDIAINFHDLLSLVVTDNENYWYKNQSVKKDSYYNSTLDEIIEFYELTFNEKYLYYVPSEGEGLLTTTQPGSIPI